MTDLDKTRVPLPLRSGSPLRRYLRTEKAAANLQAYPEVCEAWEREQKRLTGGLGCGRGPGRVLLNRR